jgi:hypothetical protein
MLPVTDAGVLVKGARVFQPVVQRTGKSVLLCLAIRKERGRLARLFMRARCPRSFLTNPGHAVSPSGPLGVSLDIGSPLAKQE